MVEHLSPQQIERFREQKLKLSESLKLYEHLAVCQMCAEQFRAMTELSEQISPIEIKLTAEEDGEFSHLLYDEEIEPYVDNQINEAGREIVESHLEICAQCAGEVKSLQEFRESIQPSLAKSYAPRPKVTSPPKLPWPEKLFAFWPQPQPRWSLAPVAVAAAMVVVAILTAIFLLPSELSQKEELVGQNEGRSLPDSPTPPAAEANAQQTQANEQIAQSADDKSTDDEGTTKSAVNQERPVAPKIMLALQDGNRQITLDERGNLAGVESLPSSWQQEIKAALTAQELKKPQSLTGLDAQTGVLLGESQPGVPFGLASPLGTVVETDQPTFRWRELPGAESYTVTVFDSELNRVTQSEQLTTRQWRLPRPLERGGAYSWQVAALKDNQRIISPTLPAPQARFKVLDSKKAKELARARKADPSSHLVLGVLYWQAGLINEAEREFQALRRANPRSGTAKKLLQNVQAWKARAR